MKILRIVFCIAWLAIYFWFWSLDWFTIDPDSVGGWWQGIWQGWAFPCNFVRSFFTDCLYIAPERTTAYMIFFGINAFFTCGAIIRSIAIDFFKAIFSD